MDSGPSSKLRFRRSQFAVVLVLSPLNDTFERKCLVVPFSPDVLKLGRQTTTRTAASPDNGFFDSRVLSRQHAEIWADRESGKVWLRDCKSSNGTYINKHRLSPENTESEPQELKKNDQLDLGIDIVCNDDTKQMYKKISARIEKVSMLPLHVGLQQKQQHQQLQRQAQAPPLSRSPSLETLRCVNTQNTNSAPSLNGRHSEAIFGPTSMEALALTHANASTGNIMMKDSIKSKAVFELAAKRLVAEIRAVRADTAKLQSVTTLLEDIKRAALDAEQQEKVTREKLENEQKELARRDKERKDRSKSSSLAALKAENARIRAEIAHLTGSRGQNSRVTTSKTNGSSSSSFLIGSPSRQAMMLSDTQSHNSNLASSVPETRTVQHNATVLIGTTILVTLTGVWIMFFFNPPMAPRSQNPLFFNILSKS